MSRPPAAVVLALLVSACTTASSDSAAPATAPARATPLSGQERLRLGDFDGAARELELEISSGRATPETREALANAKHRAAAVHAAAASAAADAGDIARARSELARADAFDANSVAVRDAHAAVDARVAAADRAAELRQRAREVVANDPDEADRLLAEADATAPGNDADAKLRRQTVRRADAERSSEAAAAAWARRDRPRTVAELSDAQISGRPTPKAVALRRLIEKELVAETASRDEATLRAAIDFADDAQLDASVVRVLREHLVERLIASSRDLRETHRPATAALLELDAKRLRGDVKTPAYDEVREKVTVVIVVSPFVDESGQGVDGAMIARALRERLALDAAGGGLPLRAVDAPAADVKPSADATRSDALRLTGRVLTARATDGRVGRENRKVPYQSGRVRKSNRDYADQVARLREESAAVVRAEEDRRFALMEVQDARAEGSAPARGATRPGEIRTTTRLALAQSRLDAADAALKRAKDAEASRRALVAATPQEIDEPVWEDRNVVVTIKVKTAQLTAHVELTDGESTLLSQDVTAAADHKETIADGFAPAGLAADPDETPDDAAMAAKAADRFAAVCAGRVRAAAEKAVLRRLDEARAAQAAGRRDEAAEAYALYLLGTPDVVSPERDEAARALADLLGVHVALRTGVKRDKP